MSGYRWLAGVSLCVLPWLAQAAQPQVAQAIAIPHTVPYADGVGTSDLRSKCDWNTRLSSYIVTDAKGLAVVADHDAADPQGAYLTMTVISAHAIGGGGFSGPKWARVRGELHEHGELVGSFVARTTTSTGGWTACSAMNKIAKRMASGIAEWLAAPTLDATL